MAVRMCQQVSVNNNMDVRVGCPYRQDKLPDSNMSALTSLVCQVGLTMLP